MTMKIEGSRSSIRQSDRRHCVRREGGAMKVPIMEFECSEIKGECL